MSPCALCETRSATVGVLCEACVGVIDVSDHLCPEQIASHCEDTESAWLVDRWGRPHPLMPKTLVGRHADFDIHAASISRVHATVEREGEGWRVRDLDSHNGSFLNGARIDGDAPIRTGDRVRFGSVRFLFVARPIGGQSVLRAQFATRSVSAGQRAELLESEPAAPAGFRLIEAPRGGGGLLRKADTDLRLTVIQFELIGALATQLERDAGEPDAVRGYVPSIELMTLLPWSTNTPDEVNLRQLVRRLRRRLAEVGLTIEGRHGFGYRLRAVSSQD